MDHKGSRMQGLVAGTKVTLVLRPLVTGEKQDGIKDPEEGEPLRLRTVSDLVVRKGVNPDGEASGRK